MGNAACSDNVILLNYNVFQIRRKENYQTGKGVPETPLSVTFGHPLPFGAFHNNQCSQETAKVLWADSLSISLRGIFLLKNSQSVIYFNLLLLQSALGSGRASFKVRNRGESNSFKPAEAATAKFPMDRPRVCAHKHHRLSVYAGDGR